LHTLGANGAVRDSRQVFCPPPNDSSNPRAGADAANALTQSVVGMADAASHIQDVATKIAAVNKENMRNEDNEFNIRNQFLSNAVNAIKDATCSQFNIVICTNQEHDDFQNLQGQILPMNLLNLEIAPNKFVDFQIYVFDTGNYLRHGKYEGDYWQFWGQSKKCKSFLALG
jgi:hypothetical protein